jgi:regulator of protease activity HflC (stomatin/prohibitin superfamily)
MPFFFYLALFLLFVAVCAAIVSVFVERPDDKVAARIGAGIAVLLFVGCLLIASANIVGTRQVGIVTSFGKPTGTTLSNGLHWVLPWKKVHEMDAAIQNDVFNGEHRVSVRLGNNSTALADVNIRWEIRPDAADELFQQYKDFANVRSNLIERNMRVALNEAFTQFDPLSSDPNKNNLSAIPTVALKALQGKVGDQVQILDLSVPIIDYDDNTENRINSINEERAKTTQAEQQVKTNDAKRQAAEKLANMPVPDLQIAISACVNKMAESGTALPCFPIGGVVPTLAVPNPMG